MKELYKALAEFQQDVPIILKDTQGYGYKYADWATILTEIKPFLKKHGLGFTQPLQGTCVKTIIFHIKSGETLETEAEIPQGVSLKGMNDFQVLGSAVTYIRRYMLSSALGLVTDKDTDAGGEQEKKYYGNQEQIEWQKEKEKEKEKPWFNQGTDNWTKALEQKATIETVKQHYIISKENEETYKQELLKQ